MLNNQTSHLEPVSTRVPQGSVYGITLFLICANYLPNSLKTIANLFVKDNTLFLSR